MPRNYGLGHIQHRAKVLPRQLATARRRLSFSIGYAAQRLFERLYDRFAKRPAEPRQRVAVQAFYGDRFIFKHGGEATPAPAGMSAQCEGKIPA